MNVKSPNYYDNALPNVHEKNKLIVGYKNMNPGLREDKQDINFKVLTIGQQNENFVIRN